MSGNDTAREAESRPEWAVKHEKKWDSSQQKRLQKEPNECNDQYHLVREVAGVNFGLIVDKLNSCREEFYRFDSAGFNFYQHVTKSFSQKGNKDRFVEITEMVLKDLQINGSHQDEVDLFELTFNGNDSDIDSVLIKMAKQGSTFPISWLLEFFALQGINKTLQVNKVNQNDQTFLHILCQGLKAQEAFDIYCDYKEHYSFDLDLRNNEGVSTMEMFMKWNMLPRSIDKRNFEFFKEAIEVA